MQRVDIKIGFACNNRCHFCVQGDKRARYQRRPVAQILADLAEARRLGARAVVLTGGEPTLYEGLAEIVTAAAGQGYTTIQIQSNGRRFAYRPFCVALIAAGANEFSPALHGASAAVHDGLTRAPGSFDETVAGIKNLTALGQHVITNSVITARNCRELPDLARLLVSLGVDQFQFAFVHVLGTAADNREWVVPRKRDVMPYVHAALDVGRAAAVPCYTEAIPYCLMQSYEECVAERIIPKTRIYDAEQTVADYTAHRMGEGKAKGPDCARCSHDAICEGPWREYAELYGWDELVPLKSEVPGSSIRGRHESPGPRMSGMVVCERD